MGITILIIATGCGKVEITFHSKKAIFDRSPTLTTAAFIGPATPPTLLNINPASPSTSTTPTLDGLATTDTATVKLFTSSTCASNEIGSGSKDEWETGGISVTLIANTASQIYVQAYDLIGNPSICQSITIYQHDSNGPTPVDSLSPGSATLNMLSQSPPMNWAGGAVDAGIGFDHYEYSIGTTNGGTNIVDWTSAGTSTSTTATGLSLTPETFYYFNLRAIDLLGNLSTVTTASWQTHAEALAIAPTSANLLPRDSQTFSATGGYLPIIYSLSIATGSINSTTGQYTSPNDVGNVTVYATDDTATQVSATVNIALVIVATTSSKTLATNEKYQFSATNGFPAYTWLITSGSGSIDSSTGDYIAPLTANMATIRTTDIEGYFDNISITTNEFVESDRWGLFNEFNFRARALTRDSAGNIYAGGGGGDRTDGSFPHWIIRKWDGSSWTTIEDYMGSTNNLYALTSDNAGNIYAAGVTSGYPKWTVRKWNGTAWSTIDEYQMELNQEAEAHALTADNFGNVYTAGYARNTAGYYFWIVKKWDGSSWTVIDNYQLAANKIAQASALTSDGTNIYSTGCAQDASNYFHWIVRKWDGSSWSTIGDYRYVATKASNGTALTLDGNGYLYTSGYVRDASNYLHWIVRKWDGSSWSTIDDYQLSANKAAFSYALISDNGNNVYAGGYAQDASGAPHWIVKKWNGSSWTTVDDYLGEPGSSAAYVSALTTDNAGSFYAGGYVVEASGAEHWIVRTGDSSWNTSDNFSMTASISAGVNALAQDGASNIYATGWADDGSGVYDYGHWIVRRWNGSSWSTIDDFRLSINEDIWASANAVTVDGSGSIYVTGYATDDSYYEHWIVRKWDGSSWSTIDDYQLEPTKKSVGHSIVADGSGIVYASGQAYDISNYAYWIVRKWDGSSWSTIDDYQLEPTKTASSNSLVSDNAGNIFIAGSAKDASNYYHWIIRKWDGSSWSTIDDYQLEVGYDAMAFSLMRNNDGTIYVTGSAKDASNYYHWVIRKWDGSSWSTIDNYQLTADGSANAYSITQDGSGNLYVTGNANDTSYISHWIVRKWNGQYWSTVRDEVFSSTFWTRSATGNALIYDTLNDLIYCGGQREDGWSSDWYVEKLP
ncbi:MAG: hypothetical protein A2485_00015 [Bdellovibrionales bacterium RIFOXYC12_FULL_39_17]|nr:MAG: hypothetical protein A2485_00015 [Bdellovibrionales bacterium RIFOXYC12_FULL_39_17]